MEFFAVGQSESSGQFASLERVASVLCPDADLQFLHSWTVPEGVLVLVYASKIESIEIHLVRKGDGMGALSNPNLVRKTPFGLIPERVHAR
jgi:hypothetical protein